MEGDERRWPNQDTPTSDLLPIQRRGIRLACSPRDVRHSSRTQSGNPGLASLSPNTYVGSWHRGGVQMPITQQKFDKVTLTKP